MTVVAAATVDVEIPLSYVEQIRRPGPATGSKSLVVKARARSEHTDRSWTIRVARDTEYHLRMLSLFEASAYGVLPLGFTPPDGTATLVLLDVVDGLETSRVRPKTHAITFRLVEVV